MARRTHSRLPWPSGRSGGEMDASFFETDSKAWPRPDSPEVSVFTPEEEAESHKRWQRAKFAERFRGPMAGTDALGFGISAASIAALAGLGQGVPEEGESGDAPEAVARHGKGQGDDAPGARKTVFAGDLEKPAVTSKSGGSATQVFLDSGADAVFANPLSSRADAGFTVRRAPRGSSAPFDGRVAAGSGTERGTDAAQVRKAESAASEAKGPLVGDSGAGALRAPMDAAGAVGVALVMRPEAPEHARAEEREQVAAAKGANALPADQQHAAVVAASEPKAAASQAAAVRAEARPADPEGDGQGRTADAAVVSDTKASGFAKGEGSAAGTRGEARETAAHGDRVEESRVGDAPDAAVMKAKEAAEADDADGQGHAKPLATDGARTKDASPVESKADAGRGTMDTTGSGKAKEAPSVDAIKPGQDHTQSATTEHAPVKDASLLIGATTISNQSASVSTLAAGKAEAKGTSAADAAHAQATSIAADAVKAAASVAAAQPVKSGQAATDGHDQAAKATTVTVETHGQSGKAAAASLADVPSQAAKTSPAVETHNQPEKPAASAVDAPTKAAATGIDASGQAAKLVVGATDASPQTGKAATTASDLHGQADKSASPAVDTAAKASVAADAHGPSGTAVPSSAANTVSDTHGQPAKAAADAGTHGTPAATAAQATVAVAVAAKAPAATDATSASVSHGQDKAVTPVTADDHSHPAATTPNDGSHSQTIAATPVDATAHAQPAASAPVVAHVQTAEATPVVAHVEPAGATPVVAHAQPAEVAPVVIHAQPAEAAPVVTHAQPAEAAPAVTHAQPAEATPVVAHAQPAEAAPAVTHAQTAEATPVVAHVEPVGATPVVVDAQAVEATPALDHSAVPEQASAGPVAEGSTVAAAPSDTALHFPDLWIPAGTTHSAQPIVLSPDPAVPPAPAEPGPTATSESHTPTDVVLAGATSASIVDGGTTHSADHALLQFASVSPHDLLLAPGHTLDGPGSGSHPFDPTPLVHPTGDVALL